MQNHFNPHRHIDLSEVDSVVSSIIRSFINRARIGKEKYGKTLDRTDLKVTDWINHAQEELMDGILYLEKLKQTSGTILLNHIPSPPDTPPIEERYLMNENNAESVCTKDCACDIHAKNQQVNNNLVEFHISVLTGEQCNKEKEVLKSNSLSESNLIFDSLKANALTEEISALILYEVNTISKESKEVRYWFYDEIDIEKEFKKYEYGL